MLFPREQSMKGIHCRIKYLDGDERSDEEGEKESSENLPLKYRRISRFKYYFNPISAVRVGWSDSSVLKVLTESLNQDPIQQTRTLQQWYRREADQRINRMGGTT